MAVAGEWYALENGRLWRMVGAGEWQSLENGSRWSMAVAGEWYALENGRLWRMVGAGEWQSLENGQSPENGSRWRMAGAGEIAPASSLNRTILSVRQPWEPKMGAVWSLKLLPMVPNVTFSGYKFVPLLPYLEREQLPLHGKNSLELGSCNA